MKIERTKNAGRNIVFGAAHTVYGIAVPFLIRTLLIKLLGERYLGLNSVFSSVLQVLNLAELGVGSAMIYNMYKPISEDDGDTICALMAMYRRFYFLIGLTVCLLGLALMPFLPRLIRMDTVPADVNVYILYAMNLGATVASYWLFAYKSCLLNAHQRDDVLTKVNLVTTTLTYLLQLAVLLWMRNFYLYTAVALAIGALGSLVTAAAATRMYPDYHPRGKLPACITAQIGRNVRDLFTSKIGSVVYDSADTLVISAFLGLSVLAVYQNYFYVLTSVSALLAVVFRAIMAGIGNSLAMEAKEKNFRDFRKLTFIISWLSAFCTVCMICLYQPFMELWAGKELMFPLSVAVCFGLYFYLRQINNVLTTYKDAAGMWHEDRFRPLVAALSNLCLNILLVRYIGIYGVILSTVAAVALIGQPWLLVNLFTVLFDRRDMKHYVRELLGYGVLAAAESGLCLWLCGAVRTENLWLCLAVRLVICLIVPNLLHWLVLCRSALFRETVELFDSMTGGRLRFLTRYLVR